MLTLLSAFISQKNKFFLSFSKACKSPTEPHLTLPLTADSTAAAVRILRIIRANNSPTAASTRPQAGVVFKQINSARCCRRWWWFFAVQRTCTVRTTVQGVRKKFNIPRTSTLSDHVPSELCCCPVIFSIISSMLLLCVYGKVGKMLLNSSLLFCKQKIV